MAKRYKYAISIIGVIVLITVGCNDVSFSQQEGKAEQLAKSIAQEKHLQQEENEILARERTRLGIESYKKGNYPEAVRQLTLALELKPNYEKAKEYLNLALSNILSSSQEHFSEGLEYYRQGEFAKAISELEQIPENNRYYNQAQEYIKSAQKTLRSAEVPDPSSPDFEKFDIEQDIEDIEKEQELVSLKKEAQEKRMMLDVSKAYLPPEKLAKEKKEAEKTAEEIAEEKKEEKQRELIEKMNKNIVPALSLTDANIKDVIRELMKMTGVTIILDEGALKRAAADEPIKVSFTTVSPMPLLDLIDVALKTTELAYKVEPNYIWISDEKTLSQEELVTKTYRLKHGVRRSRDVSLIEFDGSEK
jgi:tetratricopeptide (TPR) repeat protein